MDTFGFLGLVGAEDTATDPTRFPLRTLDKVVDDDEGIAFVTLGVVGMRLVLLPL